MKRIIMTAMVILILFGCSKNNGSISGAMNLRQELLKGQGCSFLATVTADYSDRSYCFTLDCNAQNNDKLDFLIKSPESISGIAGSVSDDGGELDFDEMVLLFEPLVNGQVSPAIGPWLMVKAIRGGYIRSASAVKNGYEYCFDDSYQSENYQVLLTVNENGVPVFCEIVWLNSRVLAIQISEYKDL